MYFLAVALKLLSVEALCVLQTFIDVVGYIHSGFMMNTVDGHTVHFRAQKSQLSTCLFSCLTSILGLKTREPELEVEAKSVMKLEGVPVQGPTSQEDELTEAPVVLVPVVSIGV